MAPTCRTLSITCFMILALASPARADEKRLLLGVGFESAYDDNILQYSRDQIALFESGTRPTRFSIESTDDAVFQPNVSLAYENDRGRRGGRTIRARVKGTFHSRNGTSDNRAMSLSWREEFGRNHALTLSAYRLPRFYLRQLFDEDAIVPYPGLSKYRRAEFGLTIASAVWRERLTRQSRLNFNYSFEHRDYNADFSERTSDTHEGGLGYDWNRRKSGSGFGLSGGYRRSNAKADDGDGVPLDDPDFSYKGVVLGAGGKVELAHGRVGRLTGEADYEYRTRDYASDRPSDTSHYQRNDLLHDADVALRLALPGRWSVRAFYQVEDNKASFAGAAPTASDPASYTRNQVGVDVDWSAVLWSRSGAAAGGEGRIP